MRPGEVSPFTTGLQAVAFHLWSRAYRHDFQADVPSDHAAKVASQAKIKQLLAIEPSKHASHGTEQSSRAAEFGLGHMRSIQEFWHHCGVSQS